MFYDDYYQLWTDFSLILLAYLQLFDTIAVPSHPWSVYSPASKQKLSAFSNHSHAVFSLLKMQIYCIFYYFPTHVRHISIYSAYIIPFFDDLGPLLLTSFNFNPSMDK